MQGYLRSMPKKLSERIEHIELLERLNLPRNEYALTGGAWLAVMKIRPNKDIDIVVSESLKQNYGIYLDALDGPLRRSTIQFIDKSGKHGKKQMKIAKAKNLKHLIDEFSVEIDGHKFILYSLFKKYKQARNRPKDQRDKKAMSNFFADEKCLLPEYAGLFK